MKKTFKIKYVIFFQVVLLFILLSILIVNKINNQSVFTISSNQACPIITTSPTSTTSSTAKPKDFIKWVEFNVCYNALDKAYCYDVGSQTEETKLNWIELLSYLGAKYGGDFSRYKEKDLNELVDKLKSKKESIASLTKDMKHYSYYFQAYSAVLGGLVGEYEIEVPAEGDTGNKVWEKKYGLKGFSPIAKNFPYNDYDDFGVSRSYGFKRNHLGHDMMGQVGTPIIAVESGYVECLGWNQYGGWRIGIRSFDKKDIIIMHIYVKTTLMFKR